ncbi:pyridoxamine 5'-phosphate oxidase [Marinilabilia rubra]|uniref:Pyridoxine/pyridoxamine 5'-phosphate oxidase n=1 Tax=Marinilabilia rubra TaxID=2162893 RepID=A0A2U2B8K8_9BACT|nr:pyridoxamine 5'-phosphate oxidase [Marinilabilia rubra]PWD99376.1 pyridoxamine 5'-phosphate oxidase [Marinilabilia rubra]
MQSKFSNIRNDYKRLSLRRDNLEGLPLLQLKKWLEEAVETEHTEPTAMTLATVDATGQPSQRVVLLKDISDKGLTFFTNYLSKKGQHIDFSPKASVNFFWAMLERQVRLDGVVKKISAKESDAYFASRPRESQIGAWASPQSEMVQDSAYLNKMYREFEEKFSGMEIPRPARWGGYVLVPHRIEFWQGRPGRMHDRFVYQAAKGGEWDIFRLAP